MSCFGRRGICCKEAAMEIILENLSKSYTEPVLKDISYRFESGKLYVIKGISGCGKTTLLNILGGVEQKYEGKVDRPEELRCAYIFQQSLLLSSLTVRENLLLIRQDEKQIEELARELGILLLLDRLPESLSGGERQRIAVLRALLTNPQLLLADEPTASLDGKNARKIAALIASLKTEERVIIVATHDSYFDALADEIIELDYGCFRSVTVQESRPSENAEERGEVAPVPGRNPSTRLPALSYIRKRRPDLLKLKTLLLSAVFFFLVLIVSSVQNNLVAESVRISSQDKPVELLRIPREEWDLLTQQDLSKITFYDDYYAEEEDITAYYLLPKQYSVLGLDGVLSYGSFPEAEKEILVNETLAASFVPAGASPGDAVGKEITFCGVSFVIRGVIGTYRGDFRLDYYYCYGKDGKPFDFKQKHLFIFYDVLKTIGTKFERPVTMAVWPGLFQDTAARSRLEKADFSFNQYYLDARNAERSANVLVPLIFGVVTILFFVTCLYSSSMIRLELFYRRREMGYLQIFGMEKPKISRLIRLEYGIKLVASLLLGAGLHLLAVLGYAVFTGVLPWPDLKTVFAMFLLLGLIHMVMVRFTVQRFLKRSIIELIT